MNNKLEELPKSVVHNGKDYFLQVYVTAWGNLCICYKELDGENKILSYVVEKNKKRYIPDIIEETETSGINEHIGNCETLDECISEIAYKIAYFNLKTE